MLTHFSLCTKVGECHVCLGRAAQSSQRHAPTFLRACWPSCCTTSAADAAPALQRSTSSSATTPPRCCRCRTLLERYGHQVDTAARILSTPPFAHQPADNQATATHRARAAPPQDQGRVHQRARQPLLAQQRAREERTAGALGRRQQHARVSRHRGRTLNSK